MLNFQNEMMEYDTLVKKDIYIKKNGCANVLFIGGCRSFAYALIFEEYCKHDSWFSNAQFGISAIGVHIIDFLKRNKTSSMIDVFKNADFIICEQMRKYSFLNTSTSCELNIFNSFELKPTCKIIQVPNLELHIDNNEIITKQNVEYFINHCNKYSFLNVSEYVTKNINNDLFKTYNHPTTELMIEVFRRIIELGFNRTIEPTVLFHLKKITIF